MDVRQGSIAQASRYPRPVATQSFGKFERVLRVGEGRRLKQLQQHAAYIGSLEPEFEALSDDELAAKTVEFKQRFENGESLEELIFETYEYSPDVILAIDRAPIVIGLTWALIIAGAMRITDALGVLPAKLGHSPRPRDLAAAVGASVEDVLEAMEAATAYDATSLDAPRAGRTDDGDWTYADSLGADEHGYELVEIGETLRGTLEALPTRERAILRLRFEHDLTQAEIAERVGVSQMHVSRLLRRSLDRLSAAGDAAA